MKYFSFLLLFAYTSVFSQQVDYNAKKFIAEGYDVVSYFNNQAVEGNNNFIVEYDGVKFRFSSDKNLKKFKENPTKYIPQYGGYCAYAMAYSDKVKIDPETYEINDGKLYLFYNSWGTNTLEKWLEENPETLRKKANENWDQLKYKN